MGRFIVAPSWLQCIVDVVSPADVSDSSDHKSAEVTDAPAGKTAKAPAIHEASQTQHTNKTTDMPAMETVEVPDDVAPQTQYTDKIIDVTFVETVEVPAIHEVVPQNQCTDKIDDVPVVKTVEVPVIHDVDSEGVPSSVNILQNSKETERMPHDDNSEQCEYGNFETPPFDADAPEFSAFVEESTCADKRLSARVKSLISVFPSFDDSNSDSLDPPEANAYDAQIGLQSDVTKFAIHAIDVDV